VLHLVVVSPMKGKEKKRKEKKRKRKEYK